MAFGFGFPLVTFGKAYCQRPGTGAILPSFLCLSTIFHQAVPLSVTAVFHNGGPFVKYTDLVLECT